MRRIAILTVMSTVAVLSAAIFAPTASALDIADTVPVRGQVGVPYSHQFNMTEGSGSPGMTWRISSGSLPPGLVLSYEGERWARVTGTPTTAGSWTFYLQAIDVPGPYVCCTETQFTITIDSKLIVSTNSLADANINQAYSAGPLQVSGGTATSWSLAGGALPDGLALASTGMITGTPTKSGAFTFTVQANGTPNNDTKQLSIFVIAPLVLGGPGGAPPRTEPVPVNAKVQTPFSWGIQATGGRAPYAYGSSTLPAGVTLDPNTGLLTGTPTVAGTTRVTFQVRDSAGTLDSLSVTLTVKALLAFSLGAPKVGRIDRFYSWKIPVTGASKTRIFLASGRYPPGLELDEATGVVSGFALRSGSFRIKVWVLGDPGTQIFKAYTIKITK